MGDRTGHLRLSPQLTCHDVLTPIGSPGFYQKVGSSQQSTRLTAHGVGMIVDDQLHTCR